MARTIRISSAVEQWTVNPLVASSNLASGDHKPLILRGFFISPVSEYLYWPFIRRLVRLSYRNVKLNIANQVVYGR